MHDGASISNRVSLSTNWTRASRDLALGTDFDQFRHPNAPVARADHRLAVTGACVAQGPDVDAAHVAHTLRDHSDGNGSGFSVCLHRPEFNAQTTASMIVDLPADGGAPRGWACLGNPCVGVFVPVFPGAVAPELADPGQWARFARVRDLVDAGSVELAAVRAALDPIEQELWAAADFADATGNPTARARFAADAFAPVHPALAELGV